MQRKKLVILFSFILMSSFFISGIYAQETTDAGIDSSNLEVVPSEDILTTEIAGANPEESSEQIFEEETEDEVAVLVEEAKEFNEELSVNAGITPDSGLYFVEDKILAPFRDDSVNREKKIAEMRELAPKCGQGEQSACEDMRKSFERYQEYATDFERDVSPEQREDAIRSSEAIRGVYIREIAQNVPAGEKDEFIRDIVLAEKDIETAAEIAGKIKELCEQLSELDPNEYSRVCRIEGDAPDWRKKLDKDLTEEQRGEAEKFGEIMSQCFETAGQNCRCEEIPFSDFAEACSIAAPLATACEIENNEEACNKLDSLEMPELPNYLQDIMDDLEGGMNEDKYGMFLPPECEKAGATTPKECAKIMINEHAPEECKPALLEANVQSEREAREICDKIMFEQNAPLECVEAGIRNPGECGKFMFSSNAPQECIDAGITGEKRDDPRKCQQLMESQFRGQEFGGPGEFNSGDRQNFAGAGNCAGIKDSQERLKCYDGAGKYVQEFHEDFRGRFEETQNRQRQCAEDCRRKNSAWDFSNGNCVCKAPDFEKYDQRYEDNFRQDFDNRGFEEGNRGDFRSGQYYPPQGQPGQFQQPQDYQQYNQQQPYQQPPEGYQYPQPPQDYQQYNQQQPYQQQPPSEFQQSPTSTTPSTESTTSGTSTTTIESTSTSSNSGESSGSTTSSSGSSSSGSSGESSSSEGGSITGGVIGTNKFLRFWFWKR